MSTTEKIRVLVVDDSYFMRRVITEIIESDSGLKVVGHAEDGVKALEKAEQLDPDVITLDIAMPEMDGVAVLRRIMSKKPKPVVIISGKTAKGGELTMECLSLGAIDYIHKPTGKISNTNESFSEEIVSKVYSAKKANLKKKGSQKKSTNFNKLTSKNPDIKLVAIGSSTGGPPIIEEILKGLKEDFTPTIVIAQHMPDIFVDSFIKRLSDKYNHSIKKAKGGMELEQRCIYICPGGINTEVVEDRAGRMTFRGSDSREGVGSSTPSVNKLFESTAKIYGKDMLGIVLTGMGSDGTQGASQINKNGGIVITQNEATATVYGMPGAVKSAGFSDAEVNAKQIAQTINSI